MAPLIMIIIAGTVVLAGILIILVTSFRGDRNSEKDEGDRRGIAVYEGVDVKNLVVGKDQGAVFKPGMEDFGTVLHGGGRRPLWNVHFQFPDTGREEDISFRTQMVIGRKGSSMNNFIYLEIENDKLVSSIHCYLIAMNGGLSIRDAGSLNHTYLNGKRVDDTKAVPNGSIIKVGNSRIRITYRCV